MNDSNITEFEFLNHIFTDVKLEKCASYSLRQGNSEKFFINKGFVFIITLNGKGSASYFEQRQSLTKGSGLLCPTGYTIQIKADTLEPLSFIMIKIIGDNIKQLTSLIEEKEKGLLMNINTNVKILDAAIDLFTECTKSYRSDFSLLSKFYEFLSNIEEHYVEKKIPTKNAYMTKAIDYIKKNYNKNITVENIADILGIERSYLSRLFKTYKNKSTQNYIIDFRIAQAKKLFEEEDMNVSQVSTAVGYTNIYCFSRIFKSRVGMPPKEYMEHCKKKSL